MYSTREKRGGTIRRLHYIVSRVLYSIDLDGKDIEKYATENYISS